MEFVRENVLDCFDLEKAVIGSKGYFCDSLFVLKQIVQEDERKEGQYSTLWKAQKKSRYPFHTELGEFKCEFFYPVEMPEEMPEEKKWRPFKNTQELKDVFCKFFFAGQLGASDPFIWIREKNTKKEYMIVGYNPLTKSVYTDSRILSLEALFIEYTFLDGSQCGVAE